VVVGFPIAGRTQRETEALIGFFINTLVLRTDLSGDLTFRKLLKRVREGCLGAYAHQDLPFEALVEALQPERSLSHAPVIQVMFVEQNLPHGDVKLPNKKVRIIETAKTTAKYDLILAISDVPQGLTARLTYSSDLFDPDTSKRMLRNFETLLTSAVSHPDARLSVLEILTEAEKKEEEKKQMKLKDSQLEKLMNARPRALSMSEEILVRQEYLQPQQTLPLVMRPNIEGVELVEWAKSNRTFIERQLLKHGAILFRKFDGASTEKFEQLARVVSPELMEYRERSSPRHRVSRFIYTSTDHPADQPIALHNEQSYSLRWMMKLWFYCMEPAEEGGRTPLADSRKILSRLSQETIEQFGKKQVTYLRNYGDGLGLSWEEAFQSSEKSMVEQYCREAFIEFKWEGHRLRTRQVRPAIRKHPKTGEVVWFNHAFFFHISSLEASTQSILAGIEEKELPYGTYYGDGSAVEPSTLEEIREAYRQETVFFHWNKGDILLLDNMLVAHGREPFKGPRKVLVAMAEPFEGINAQ